MLHANSVVGLAANHAGKPQAPQLNCVLAISGLVWLQDNCNRLWDIRNSKVKCRFKGHQNTSKNLIRAHFGPEHGGFVSLGPGLFVASSVSVSRPLLSYHAQFVER